MVIRKSRKNYYVMGIVVTILLLFGMMICSTKPVFAASKRTEAVKAYKKFISGSTFKWNNSVTFKSEDCSFALVYVDNDSIPELLVMGGSTFHAAGHEKLYTYKNGKVKLVYTGIDGLGYYKKTGIFYSIRYSQMEVREYLKLSGSSSKTLLKKTYRNGWSYYDKNEKKISKSIFNKKLKSYTKGKKAVKTNYHRNTAYNRAKYLK